MTKCPKERLDFWKDFASELAEGLGEDPVHARLYDGYAYGAAPVRAGYQESLRLAGMVVCSGCREACHAGAFTCGLCGTELHHG